MPFVLGQKVIVVRADGDDVQEFIGEVMTIIHIDKPIYDNIPIQTQIDANEMLSYWKIDEILPYNPTDEEMQRYALWKMKQ